MERLAVKAEPEWRTLLLKNFKQNNPSDLMQLLNKLTDTEICLQPLDGSNMLEYAILNQHWNSAHVLVHFLCGGRCDEPYNRSTYSTSPANWAKAIHRIVKYYLKKRVIQSLQHENCQVDLKTRMKAYFTAYDKGCVNLFEAVNYPRTFILLTQLGANIRAKDDKMYHLLTSNNINFNVKATLMRYIKRVAPNMLNEPCGALGAAPVLYCYVNNYVVMLKEVNMPFDEVLKLRTTYGKSLVHLISFKLIKKLLNSEQLFKLFSQEGALDILFQREANEHQSFFFPEIVQAFDAIVAQGKHPIPTFASRLENPHLIVYLQNLGVSKLKLETLTQFDGRRNKNSRKSNVNEKRTSFYSRFPLDKLPLDMLASILDYLPIQDMSSMFSVTKAMHQIYNSASLPWKNIARNSFNKLKFKALELSQNSNASWRPMLQSQSELASNWNQGKFTLRQFSEDPLQHVSLSEHWGVWSNYGHFTFWNCNTDERKKVGRKGNMYWDVCFIESLPGSLPIVAASVSRSYQMFANEPSESVVIFSPEGTLSTIKLVSARGVSLLGTGQLIAGDRLAVIDIAQEKVVTSFDHQIAACCTVNKFTASPTVIAVDNRDREIIQWFDQHLQPIRKLELTGFRHWIRHIHAIDEHRVLVASSDGWKSLDDRFPSNSNEQATPFNFPLAYPGFYGKYSLSTQSVFTVDEVNERMMLHIRDFGYSMVWDLRTLTWKNIYRDAEELGFMAINSRFQAFVTSTRRGFIRDYSPPDNNKNVN